MTTPTEQESDRPGPFLPALDSVDTTLSWSIEAQLAVLSGSRADLEVIAEQAANRGLLPELLSTLAYAPLARRVTVRVGELVLDGVGGRDAIARTMRELSDQIAPNGPARIEAAGG